MDVNEDNGERRLRSRKATAKRVKWTDDMERAVLEYAKEGIAIGCRFEKPSAPEYYKRFLRKHENGLFEGVTADKLLQHVKNMKSAYTKALEWRSRTGQGILATDLENGVETVQLGILKRCKFFEELDEILGDKPQFNPPYVNHIDSVNAEGGQSPLNLSDTSDIILDPVDTPDDNVEIVIDLPMTNAAADGPPAKKSRKSPIKSAAAAMENSMKARVAVEEKRLNWEKERDDRSWSHQQEQSRLEYDFRSQQLRFEREKWEKEVFRQSTSDDRQFELDKLKIEKDAELQRIKMQNDFELEKLKLSLK